MTITYSSCFYILKSKVDAMIYVEWMNNFISIVNHFNLVIYTDENSFNYIDTKNNPRIKIIIKPITDFYTYKYKDFWISNHQKNDRLNSYTEWTLNMLWSEKIWFVKETKENKYFDTEIYGWCDIGYFRNDVNDTNINDLKEWSHSKCFSTINKNRIWYTRVNNNDDRFTELFHNINTKNNDGLPIDEIPSSQFSIAGGFFIIHKDKIEWWVKTYYDKLQLYVNHNRLVKDDQIIIIDCICSNIKHFLLFKETCGQFDHWFMFQRILNN